MKMKSTLLHLVLLILAGNLVVFLCFVLTGGSDVSDKVGAKLLA